MGAPSSKPDRGYLPCPNPPVVCRRDGCREPATGALGLCASHLASLPGGADQGWAWACDTKPPKAPRVGGMTRLAAELERVGWSLDDLLLRPAWHAQAACRGASPALFFGKASQGVGKVYEVTRAAYCAACPVVAECAAAGDHEEHGLWGGMSVRERAEARGAARVVPRGVAPAW